MSPWRDWAGHARAFRSPYVDWEVALFERLGRLDAMTMIPVPPLLVGSGQGDAPGPGGRDVFPVPRESANPDPGALVPGAPLGMAAAGLPPLAAATARETVVVGVIDIDVGFGHRRFRTGDGASRVLAAWQQGAPWAAGGPAGLPFGEMLAADEIDALIAAHGGAAGAPVEHDGFYRRLGLVTPERPDGLGGLAGRAAHGTHVLGRVAGQDPRDDPDGLAERMRLLVVNLPPPTAFGEGGAFLDYYLSYGLQWIVETHAAIAAATIAAGRIAAPPPLFVNLSFGKQAGAPDRWQGGGVLRAPGAAGVAPVVLVAAGNDNLARCHARFELGAEDQSLALRVQPDDATTNFVEIWGEDAVDPGADSGPPDAGLPFAVDLELPDGRRAGFGTPAAGAVRDLADGLGRIYCDWVARDDGRAWRLRYLVCLAPDRLAVPAEPELRGAPAGRYRLHLRRLCGAAPCVVQARVQTDEATLPSAHGARRAYFEDPAYVAFEPDGRAADSYPYPWDGAAGFDGPSPIRRHGTVNAYAANPAFIAIGGFRLSDGRPAAYSATGEGPGPHREPHQGPHRGPAAAFPSDDAPAHFGVLSDGARDGSVVAMRGTSFACAAATRMVAEAALAGLRHGRAPALPGALASAAGGADWPGERVAPAKAGRGRVPYQPPRPVARL